MRQTDHQLKRSVQRRDTLATLAMWGTTLKLPTVGTLGMLREAHNSEQDIKLLTRRSRHVHQVYFNLNILSELECVSKFRFEKRDIGTVVDGINWYEGVTKRSRYRCDPVTATCVVLRKLAAPVRWFDVELEFGMRSSHLSEVFWEVVECFVSCRSHVLDVRAAFMRSRAELYAAAIEYMGAPLDRCVGFLDCTKIRMTRPGGANVNQRSCYSGHKRMHCLMYMTITTPDGLMFALHGPVEGRRHDLTLMRQSGWEEVLADVLDIEGVQYYVYADSAFTVRPYLQAPFGTVGASVAELDFNRRMCGVRVAVEWNYKDLKQQWSSNDFSRQLKVRMAPIALLYKASAILLNMRTCLYKGGQTGSYFAVQAPSVTEYLWNA